MYSSWNNRQQGVGRDDLGCSYHVEGYDILERDQTSFVPLHKRLVDAERAGSGWKTEDKGTILGRRK